MGTGVTRLRREEDERKTKFLSETARPSADFARANRAPGMDDEKIHLFEDFTLDLARGCLLRANERVHLRPQSYEVLRHLAENSGRLVGKNRLIETVWQGRAVTDDALVQCLVEVRHALGANGKLYVRNVRGRGYIFDPEAGERRQPEGDSTQNGQDHLNGGIIGADEEIVRASETDPTPAQPPALTGHATAAVTTAAAAGTENTASGAEDVVVGAGHRQRAAIILLTALVLAAVSAVIYVTRFVADEPAVRSVAVLPFANGSGDPNLEYLADGLSESLIDRLSQLPGVKVIARSSSFKYKGEGVDTRAAARALGVEALVTGRIVQRGDDLQVRAELVDARAGTQIWGEQYSRRAADIQTVQEEMARTISEKLRLRLTRAEERQLKRHATENSQAYQFYLNGLFYLRRGGIENVRKALDYFNQAVALDPDFALAWVGVARANRYFSGNSLLDPKGPLARAKAATEKALELDETLAEAHVEMAGIKRDEWDWAGAEREYKRAVELNPNLVDARTWYASHLSSMGRHAEALAEIRRAQELDPLRTGLKTQEWWLLYLARRYDEALEKQRQAIEAGSDSRSLHFSLGLVYEAKGMYEQAIAEYQKFVSVEGETTWHQIILGYALAMSGRRSEARAILDELKTTEEYVSPAELAILYVGLGDNEGAIASLERAYAAHDLQMQYLKVDPHYDSLRADPRFQDLVRRVALPQ